MAQSQDYDTYFSQDYEKDGASVDWTTGTSGRYTPYLQKTDNNTYLTVQQGERVNNGCTLKNSTLKLDAGKDFTMLFDMKLGSANNQTPTKFYIKDALGADLFTIEATGTNTTKWKINGDASLVVDLAGSATNTKGTVEEGIESSSYTWYTFQLTASKNNLFLTITNTATQAVVLERTAIKSLSNNGGLSGMQFDTKRYCANLALDNILVRSVLDSDVPAASMFTITTKYQLEDGTSILEDNTASVEQGTAYTPDYKETFDDDNYRYTYKSGADEISSVGADATITIVYTREALAEWSVVAKATGDIEKTLSTQTVKDAKNASFAYPRYIADGANLYQIKKARYDQGFVNSLASVTADSEMTEQYDQCASNVVFYSEAEDISTLTSVESGAVPDRCSSGKAAYATEDAVITNLPAGVYKIKAAVFGNKINGNADPYLFEFKAGDKTVFAPGTQGYFVETESDAFTLDGNTDLILAAGGNAGNSPKVIDYIIIEKAVENVSVSAINYASYVPTCNVVAPADVKVYTAMADVENSVIKLTEIPVGSVIPAGTAVLVGAAEGSYTFTASAETASAIDASNELKAATAGTAGDGSSIYALTEKDGKAVFARVAAGVEVPVGKAYMEIKTTGNKANYFSIGGGNGTTGINNVNAKTVDDGAYYTLQGVKVNKPAANGIYIHNGKKVIK